MNYILYHPKGRVSLIVKKFGDFQNSTNLLACCECPFCSSLFTIHRESRRQQTTANLLTLGGFSLRETQSCQNNRDRGRMFIRICPQIASQLNSIKLNPFTLQ